MRPTDLQESTPVSSPYQTRYNSLSEDVISSTVSLHPDVLPESTLTLIPVEGGIPIPGFQLGKCLGKGGFGEVWQASGPGGFAIALKFIRMGGPSSDVELRSLQVMKKVRHPNLLGLFGAWERDEMLIIAMELADGNLQDRLAAAVAAGQTGIPAGELLEYMLDAARGIDYLNEPRPEDGQPHGVQHRDIKPGNLLLVGGCVKVGDFGLAKLMGNPVHSNSANLTVYYASPESLNGAPSARSDQYSLAISYCQLRGNRLPYRGTALEIMAGHLLSAPDLSMLSPADLPVVQRALSKQPEDRWPSCRDFVQALAAALGQDLGPVFQTRSPISATTDTAEWVRKRLLEKAKSKPALSQPSSKKLSRKERDERATYQFIAIVLIVLMTCIFCLVVVQLSSARDFLSDLFTIKVEKPTTTTLRTLPDF